ncbi:hypothetical protein AN8727.2 [Aspergillus nidulans FGSC A4]|uniref:Rhodopsin domain-containing protein n=1 Tax=Emericella nidulans (strain FGSC A4 / ATCC 38163 / CBS 112.46 / NRRL 194 / M139) TaxID=227321 RepID=Q5ASK3_EMENI|nr:hypothetical protein [Aspergillus nidulans FGSC A4]EAA60276.1 hypothetical protein AN8727.2 [Aspergillus nidulans FGSC A4]CBF78153.1 TPA: conserved hypothetical protein [Aspergillus nidulans FGSC A4]|eukprot:XP_681996.1 hypothetical protein AN8727.2 [Aspergillus nidulans FGSC A4]
MATAGGLPPFQRLSPDNHGPIITLISVCLLIVAVIFVLAKSGSAIYFKQRRTAGSTPIWAALVVVLQKAVDNGLGKHEAGLSESQIQRLSKYSYAAQLLLIIVLSLSKLSTALLVWKLTPSRSLRQYCTTAAVVIAGWTIFALFSISFQCQMPETWRYTPERCAGEGALLYPIAVFNIVTEIILVILPFVMMQNVQMASQKKVKILSSFSSRLCVVGLAIAHLALLPSFVHSDDIPSCVPTLYHIFAGLHSGLITTQIQLPDGVELSRTGTGKFARSKTSAYISQTSSAGGSGSRSRGRSKERGSGRSSRGLRRDSSLFDPRAANAAVVTEISATNVGNETQSGGTMIRRSSSSEGTESTRRLTQEVMGKQQGVMRTVDITVEVEHQCEKGHDIQ